MFVWFDSLRPSQYVSIMSEQVFLGSTSTRQWLMCLAEGHNAVPLLRLEPTTLWSQFKHYTTEPIRSNTKKIILLRFVLLIFQGVCFSKAGAKLTTRLRSLTFKAFLKQVRNVAWSNRDHQIYYCHKVKHIFIRSWFSKKWKMIWVLGLFDMYTCILTTKFV